MTAAGYLRRVALAAFGGLATIVLFIVIIDPKGIYHLGRIERFNAYKVHQPLYYGEVKALGLRRYRPDSLIAGASPATYGVVPECRNPTVSGVSRMYNYAGAGASVLGLIANAADLRAVGSIRRMTVELAFPTQSFLAPGAPKERPVVPLNTDSWSELVRRFLPANYARAYLANLFSWHEVVLSLQTVAANLQQDRSFLFRGFEPNGAYDQTWLRRWTARVITEQHVHGQVTNYYELYLKKMSNEMDPDVLYVEQMAQILAADGIALDLYFRPEHVSELLLYDEAHLWPLFEKFKRGIVTAVERSRAQYGANIRVFDFNTLSNVVVQPVRPVDNNTIYDPYFGDPVHYRKPVGDMILNTLYGCQIETSVPEGFGTEITPSNMQNHLAREREKLKAYRDANPDVVRRVADALRSK